MRMNKDLPGDIDEVASGDAEVLQKFLEFLDGDMDKLTVSIDGDMDILTVRIDKASLDATNDLKESTEDLDIDLDSPVGLIGDDVDGNPAMSREDYYREMYEEQELDAKASLGATSVLNDKEFIDTWLNKGKEKKMFKRTKRKLVKKVVLPLVICLLKIAYSLYPEEYGSLLGVATGIRLSEEKK